MSLYYQDEHVTLYHGGCIETMNAMPPESVEAIVTDPPYGLGFMGKEWDALPPSREWADACYRVLKPGGHIASFGGTRTWHRLAVAIEDAGFEVRDSLAWLYGSGFPKSHDVGKAIDKLAGAEREVIGTRRSGATAIGSKSRVEQGYRPTIRDASTSDITAPATPEAAQWDGWGTALKPGHEPVVVARKPAGPGAILDTIGSQLAALEEACRRRVSGAARSSARTRADSSVARTATAPGSAATQHEAGQEPTTATGEAGGSSAATVTSASGWTAETFLSTVTSWRECLAEISAATSTSTTSTATSRTTDLQTLSSCLSSIMQSVTAQSTLDPRSWSSLATAADNLFAAGVLSSRSTLALSATESATASTPHAPQAEGGSSAAFEPIVLARKPLAEKTVARNVLAHGTGAINVDACRIETDWDTDPTRRGWQGRNLASQSNVSFVDHHKEVSQPNPAGRWPANVLLDQHAAAWVDEQSGVTKGRTGMTQHSSTNRIYGEFKPTEQSLVSDGQADEGGASRFFYVAKAPKRERPNVDGVQHPTVKPLAIMRWLIRLVTPPGGTVLDPFAGSGTTIEAALIEGFDPVGIEMEADYLPLIQHRIDRQAAQLDLGGIA